jgi:hypothetical protein
MARSAYAEKAASSRCASGRSSGASHNQQFSRYTIKDLTITVSIPFSVLLPGESSPPAAVFHPGASSLPLASVVWIADALVSECALQAAESAAALRAGDHSLLEDQLGGLNRVGHWKGPESMRLEAHFEQAGCPIYLCLASLVFPAGARVVACGLPEEEPAVEDRDRDDFAPVDYLAALQAGDYYVPAAQLGGLPRVLPYVEPALMCLEAGFGQAVCPAARRSASKAFREAPF